MARSSTIFFDYFLIFCLPSRGEVMEDKYSGISTNFCKFFFSVGVWGLKAESVSGWVEDPGVVVGALHACVQSQRLSR